MLLEHCRLLAAWEKISPVHFFIFHFSSDYYVAVSNGTSVMSYFSEAPFGTVQRTLYDTKGPLHI